MARGGKGIPGIQGAITRWMLQGVTLATGSVTLTNGATTTAVKHKGVSSTSHINLEPNNAAMATEWNTTRPWVSTKAIDTFTITHANAATARVLTYHFATEVRSSDNNAARGTMDATEGADTAAMAGWFEAFGTVDATEAADTSAMAGDVSDPIPVFDAAQKPAGYTLTNDDLTAQNTSGLESTDHVQVDYSFDIDGSEKLYVEFVADTIGASNAYVGIIPASSPNTDVVGGNTGRGINKSGEFWSNAGNAGAGTGPTYTSGDVLMWAVDCANQQLYYGKNGTWFGTGSGNWRFAVTCRSNNDKFTVHSTTASLSYSIPTGFSALS
jgi:hypothetical protein